MNNTESVMRTVVAVGMDLPASSTDGIFNPEINHSSYAIDFFNWIMAILLFGVLLAGNGWIIHWVIYTDQFAIAKVRIEGEIKNVAPAMIQNTLTQQITDNFFILDIDKVRSSLETLPWIAEAYIRRVWPLTLVIWLREREALAHWGEHSLVSPEGVVFTPEPKSIPANLIYLQGPDGSTNEVISNYRWLKERFAVKGLQISKLTLSDRRAWYIDLTSGLRLSVGSQKFTERVERFLKYLSRLPQPEALEQIDLRYPNGFTARWKSLVSTP